MPRDCLHMPPGLPPVGLDAASRRTMTGWCLLAVGSLAVAGTLALLLALARTPHAQDWLPWPWQSFFRKALVTHVVFAFVVWYMTMLGGLAALARPHAGISRAGLTLAFAGAIALLIPALANQGEASLNNYVPVLIHPLFYAGLALLAAGVALPVLWLLARPPVWGGSLSAGVGTAGLIFLLALACIGLAWGLRPPEIAIDAYNEDLFWGGGHLLQFVHTALLLTAWQVLGEQVCPRAPLSPTAWRWVCALLALAALPGPFLYAGYDIGSVELRQGFTRLYWIGLPLPPVLVGAALLWQLLKTPVQWRSPVYLSLVLSLAVFALGGAFGFFADGGDTRTPAHYHAEIGGVNLAFMGLFFGVLFPALLRGGGNGWATRLQFWLYGGGQALFCLGMFAAGSAGVARKVAGDAQGLDSLPKLLGMAMTGTGGVIAVAGGVLFVWLTLRRLLGKETP